MSQEHKEVSSNIEVLNINVSEQIVTTERMGSSERVNLFPNPKNDPNIAGLTSILNQEQLNKIGPLALSESKRLGKPIILIVRGN